VPVQPVAAEAKPSTTHYPSMAAPEKQLSMKQKAIPEEGMAFYLLYGHQRIDAFKKEPTGRIQQPLPTGNQLRS
jgi:hypothetical protein